MQRHGKGNCKHQNPNDGKIKGIPQNEWSSQSLPFQNPNSSRASYECKIHKCVDFMENKGVSEEQKISDRLRKQYNIMKNDFGSEIERLSKKRDKIKDVQKSYFNKAKKYRLEKMRYVQKHREAYKKPKIEEYFYKRESIFQKYKTNFREFKQLYEKMNYRFEQRVLAWIKFDTDLKKHYISIWQNFICKFLGINQDSPILIGLPDLSEIFEDVLLNDLQKLENGRPTMFSNFFHKFYF